MKKIFSLDSPIMQILAKIADLMILNILYVISCLPVFTIGAATAALYDVTTRLNKDDALIWRHYWQAFRSNFKQATLIWLVLVVVGGLLYGCAIFYWSYELPNKDLCLILLGFVAIVLLCVFSWVFPLQARFENSMKNTLYNALLCSWSYLPRTVVIAALNGFPIFIFVFLPGIMINSVFVFSFIWFAFSAYLVTKFLRKTMDQLETLATE
jgi:uncharacterized membrane protein YesL